MSTTYEKNVVSLEFDDSKFTKKAKKATKQLEELSDKLEFKDVEYRAKAMNDAVSKSLNDVDKRVNQSVDNFNNAETVGEKILDRFQSVSYKIIDNINTKIASIGTTLLKEVTTGGIAIGLGIYETKIKAVQTILANNDGYVLTDAENVLSTLNEYANKTIYSFEEMTTSLARFTAQGVDAWKAVYAIEGLANISAFAGASKEQNNSAMYMLSQVMQDGAYMQAYQWRNFMRSAIAGPWQKEIINMLADKKAAGTLSAAATTAYANIVSGTKTFKDTLETGWFTSDLIIESLTRFTDETTELGQKAYAAASKIKTFGQAYDVIKESIGTKYASLAQYIIGDYDEASAFWTSFTEIFENRIEKSFERLTELFKEIRSNSGFEVLRTNILNIIKGIDTISNTIQNAFENIFGKISVNDILKIISGIENFISNLAIGSESIIGWEQLFTNIFDIVGSLVKTTGILNSIFRGVVVIIRDCIDYFGQILNKLYAMTDASLKIGTIVEYINEAIKWLVAILVTVFDEVLKGLYSIVTSEQFKTIFNIITGFIKGLIESLPMVIAKVGEILTDIITFIKDFLGIASPSKLFIWIGSMIMAGLIIGLLSETGMLVDGIKTIGDAIVESFNSLLDSLMNIDFGKLILIRLIFKFIFGKMSMEKAKIMIATIITTVASLAALCLSIWGLSKILEQIPNDIYDKIDRLLRFLEIFMIVIGVMISVISIVGAFSNTINKNKITESISQGTNKLFNSISGIFGSISDAIKTYTKEQAKANLVTAISKMITSIALAVGVLVAGVGLILVAIKKLDASWSDLAKAGVIVGGALLLLGILIVTIMLISNKISGNNTADVTLPQGGIQSLNTGNALATTGSILKIFKGFSVLFSGGNIKTSVSSAASVIKSISSVLYALSVAMGAMIASVIALSFTMKAINNNSYVWQSLGMVAIILVAVSGIIVGLMFAVKALNKVSFKDIGKMVVLMLSTILLVIPAVILITAALTVLSGIAALGNGELLTAAATFAIVLIALIGSIALLALITKTASVANIMAGAAAIAVYAVALVAIVGVIAILALVYNYDFKAALAASITLGAFLVAITASIAVLAVLASTGVGLAAMAGVAAVLAVVSISLIGIAIAIAIASVSFYIAALAIKKLADAFIYIFENKEKIIGGVKAITEAVGVLIYGLITNIAKMFIAAVLEAIAMFTVSLLAIRAGIAVIMIEIYDIIDNVIKPYDLGKYISQGFTDGLKAGFFGSENFIINWIKELKDIFTSKDTGFDIHSPSKWSEEMGAFIVEGFTNGINDTSTTAVYTMEEFVRKAVAAGYNISTETIEKMNNRYTSGESNGSIAEQILYDMYGNKTINTEYAKYAREEAMNQSNYNKIGKKYGADYDGMKAEKIAMKRLETEEKELEVTNTFYDTLVKVLGEENANKIKTTYDRIFGEGDGSLLKKIEAATSSLGSNFSANADVASSSTSGLSGTGSSNVNNTYAFYQTNNSPKALSRSEIYRQTKNLFAQQKGVSQGTW